MRHRTPRTSQRCVPGETFADVAQWVEHRAGRYAQVQILPSAPDAGSRPDNVRPFVVAYVEMKMAAENCTVGGNRLSVMVLHM